MSKYVTKNELHAALKEQTDEIVGVVQAFAPQMDDRFARIEQEIIDLKESHTDS